MIEAIGNYGSHLKPSSYHELRVSLLKKELEYTKDLLKETMFVKSIDAFEFMKTRDKVYQLLKALLRRRK
ncbi:hypothetical protein CR513_50628, partial [Mucuna pruriens]